MSLCTLLTRSRYSRILSLDDYLDASRTVIDYNFDDYRLVDFELLADNLAALREAGGSAECPLYDFRKSGRYAYKTVLAPESRVLIVEGIYALHEAIRPFYDLKVRPAAAVRVFVALCLSRELCGSQPARPIGDVFACFFFFFFFFFCVH